LTAFEVDIDESLKAFNVTLTPEDVAYLEA
jgi:hypothetical protein